MDVIVVGGGAAGFFAALSVREHHAHARITLLERSDKLLAKVRISGGGRCNVTHHALEPRKLANNYPRGGTFLRKAFERFNARDTIAWFAAKGVQLKVETDGRMFPVSDSSNTIVDCLRNAAAEAGVEIRLHAVMQRLEQQGDQGWLVHLGTGDALLADRVIITTGGHPKPTGYDWIGATGHGLVPPVPSLFTFNMPAEPITALMGVVADPARVRIIGTDLESTGPLLITHWGMSGPAILRLSAWGARIIHDLGYRFILQVNWVGGEHEEKLRALLLTEAERQGRKQVQNVPVAGLPRRLWLFLLDKAGIDPATCLGDMNKKERNRLVDLLTNDRFTVDGRTTFKEEFVTAGGIPLDEVDPATMQSRKAPGLYFAGEVLDVDGITGGFNFQAAWTTGFVAGHLA